MLQIPWRDSSFSHGAEFIKIGTTSSFVWHKQKGFSRSGHHYSRHKKTWTCLTAFFQVKEKSWKALWADRKSICLQILTFIVWLGIANRPRDLISSLQDIYIHQDNHSPTTQNRQQIKTFTSSATPISEYPLQQMRKPGIKRLILWMKDLGDKSSLLPTKPPLEGQVSLEQHHTASKTGDGRLNRH